VIPELHATRPGQVWSWDITKLKGPERGVYFDLEVAEMFSGPAEPPAEDLEVLAQAFGLTFHWDLVNGLIERHRLSAAVRYD